MLEWMRDGIKEAVRPFVKIKTQGYETAAANRFDTIAALEDRLEQAISNGHYAELNDIALEHLSASRVEPTGRRRLVLFSRWTKDLRPKKYLFRLPSEPNMENYILPPMELS